MLVLRFSFAGEQQYVRAFALMAADAQDLREPFQEVSTLLREHVGEQFATEGGHSRAWAPLSDGYREWKEAAYPGRPILVRSAEMRQAFLVTPSVRIERKRMEWGPDEGASYDNGVRIVDVADAHQAGAGVQRQRKIINLTAKDRREIDRVFVDFAASLGRRITRVAG